MSDTGYWLVTVSAAPWLRQTVMVARIGLTSEDAVALIESAYGGSTSREQVT